VDVDLTLRDDVNPTKTRIGRFMQMNWAPGTKAGKKEGRSWKGKRKRGSSDDELNKGEYMAIDKQD